MATPGQSSGTLNWGNGVPPISELVLDAYERCGKLGIELTPLLIQSARRSLNLVLSSWTNRGVNLWTIEEVAQFMPQGVQVFNDDASCVNILPDSVVVRQYQMGAPTSETPAFYTVSGSRYVAIANLPVTPMVGGYISVMIPVSVGGIVLQGFYQVLSISQQQSGGGGAGFGAFTFGASPFGAIPQVTQIAALVQVPYAAGSTVSQGGVVPSFTTAAGSTAVTVTLPNHGLLTGQNFMVQIQTFVGGVSLLGQYTVASVSDPNTFTIAAPYIAGYADTKSENGGLALLATQAVTEGLTQNADPVDILMYPLSRGDFMAIPDKNQQGRPTSFWINRLVVPQFNIWPVPDQNGPYELRYWRSRQVQDADITSAQTLEVPFRFIETFTADLAAHLAIKWAPDRATGLATYAAQQWTLASEEDREKVSTFMTPDMSAYYNP